MYWMSFVIELNVTWGLLWSLPAAFSVAQVPLSEATFTFYELVLGNSG